jgi:hypothetical protein
VIEGAELDLFERGVRDAVEAATGPDLDAALVDLGWHDALAADPRAAVSTLFTCQGSANARSTALDQLLLGALGVDAGAMVLPPLGATTPPGRLAGDRCTIRGLGTSALRSDGLAAIAADDGDGAPVLVVVPVAQLAPRAVDGLDPALGLVEVIADLRVSDVGTAARWGPAVALGQRALAHELVGAARAMLALARDHALARVQFGRPIASFQAVRHRLADCLVAIEAADALLAASWDDPSPVNAATVKAFAGRSGRAVARHCQQVLAGIGFTSEHPFHRHLRRTVVLDQLLGGTSLTRRLGEDVLRTRRLPPVLPL